MTDWVTRTIIQRLSLRPPQTESLEILADALGRVTLAKGADPAVALAAIRAQYPQVEDFERDFPSLCFALAMLSAAALRLRSGATVCRFD